jgi:exosortase/archaeosortase family protein
MKKVNLLRKFQGAIAEVIHLSNQSWHSRIVAAGFVAVSIFVPFWLYDLIVGTIHGAASVLLVSLSGFGFYQLWQKRSQLAELEASEEDRLLGHIILISAIAAAPFCFSTEWMQKLDLYFVLFGAAVSSWGFAFFPKYPLQTFLIFAGFFPQPTAMGKLFWTAFTPEQGLERFMAWCGGIGLRLIGQSPNVTWDIISLPTGSVKVDWGCNGFDLATIAAVTSLLLGIFWKQPMWKVTLFVLMGIFFSLLANVPRIVLMTLAAVYWGHNWFEFWHGFWGGQIFLSLLFTVHYYAMLALLEWKPFTEKKILNNENP